jgi:hypothetical protein
MDNFLTNSATSQEKRFSLNQLLNLSLQLFKNPMSVGHHICNIFSLVSKRYNLFVLSDIGGKYQHPEVTSTTMMTAGYLLQSTDVIYYKTMNTNNAAYSKTHIREICP